MKKILVIIKLSIALFFISDTAIGQEAATKIKPIPESITQKRIEPSYTPPVTTKSNEAVKPNIDLQAKPNKSEQSNNNKIDQKEEIPQPVIVPANVMQPLPASTIDTKLNTDKYYNQKPLMPVAPAEVATKQVIKEKITQKPVVVIEN